MLVPEASMHEDDFFRRWEYEVRAARKIFSVQAEAVAHFVH
jgi:hypothetical protein